METQRIAKLSVRNKLAFTISLLSFLFLIPGIYLSMLTINTTGSVNANIPHVQKGFLGIPSVQGTENKHFNINLMDTSRSILNTVSKLWEREYYFVACMIFTFSVLIPVLKGILLTYIFFHRTSKKNQNIFWFVKSIGKWSMCDVFIVATFLTYLSTGAAKVKNVKSVSMMGYEVNVDVVSTMHADLHTGFWCFLAYCLLSLLALQLYDPK